MPRRVEVPSGTWMAATLVSAPSLTDAARVFTGAVLLDATSASDAVKGIWCASGSRRPWPFRELSDGLFVLLYPIDEADRDNWEARPKEPRRLNRRLEAVAESLGLDITRRMHYRLELLLKGDSAASWTACGELFCSLVDAGCAQLWPQLSLMPWGDSTGETHSPHSDSESVSGSDPSASGLGSGSGSGSAIESDPASSDSGSDSEVRLIFGESRSGGSRLGTVP